MQENAGFVGGNAPNAMVEELRRAVVLASARFRVIGIRFA